MCVRNILLSYASQEESGKKEKKMKNIKYKRTRVGIYVHRQRRCKRNRGVSGERRVGGNDFLVKYEIV